ncbi:hypothetical protein CMO89_02795 [Candidatus Woesearchaeota archaeon]|nr:hypothetical protein [Candidatus Woesearchaeota archaeon]|tara:strand:- start:957 stop:1550 length:594 start_codon:yes stop_codon:yes gene_type:complete
MNWQKISDTSDLISYEKKQDKLNIRIEARLNKNRTWSIYKTYFNGESNNFVEEYKARDVNDARRVVNSLIEGKDLSQKEIEDIKVRKSKGLNVSLKRAFKEYDFEKWIVFLNNDNVGFLNVRYDERVEVDLVVDENFRFLERELLDELNTALGLTKMDDDVFFNNYYYKHHSHKSIKRKRARKLVLGKIEIGMGFKE